MHAQSTALNAHDAKSRCPNCRSGQLVEGKLLGQFDLGGGLAFRPKGRGFFNWLLRRDLAIRYPIFACAACGLMWSFINPKPLKKMMPPPSPAEPATSP